jgi:hypothetical protein
VHAADGDPLTLGTTNTESTVTEIDNGTVGGVGLRAIGGGVPGLDGASLTVTGPLGNPANTGVRGIGTDKGVLGESRLADASLAAGIGVQGASGSGPGVRGDSTSGAGVVGNSSSDAGVRGRSVSGPGMTGESTSEAGVRGISQTGPGAVGIRVVGTGAGAGVAGFAGGVMESPPIVSAGVYGAGAPHGVLGVSSAGAGVSGRGTGTPGVWGQSFKDSNGAISAGVQGSAAEAPGAGVFGYTNTGYGVIGQASDPSGTGVLAGHGAGGDALRVDGKATFSRSGVATIPAGASSVTVAGVPLTAASIVLATLQNLLGKGEYVIAAVPSAGTGSFTVYLNRAASAAAKVGWFVVN